MDFPFSKLSCRRWDQIMPFQSNSAHTQKLPEYAYFKGSSRIFHHQTLGQFSTSHESFTSHEKWLPWKNVKGFFDWGFSTWIAQTVMRQWVPKMASQHTSKIFINLEYCQTQSLKSPICIEKSMGVQVVATRVDTSQGEKHIGTAKATPTVSVIIKVSVHRSWTETLNNTM